MPAAAVRRRSCKIQGVVDFMAASSRFSTLVQPADGRGSRHAEDVGAPLDLLRAAIRSRASGGSGTTCARWFLVRRRGSAIVPSSLNSPHLIPTTSFNRQPEAGAA